MEYMRNENTDIEFNNNLPETAAAPEKRGNKVFMFLKEWMKDVIPAILITYLLFGVLFNIVIVSGISMLPTLNDGSIIVVKHAFYTPERGDIVVCTPPNYGKQLVKRVIAVAGDTVDINYATGQVYVNGELLEEDYINEETYTDYGTVFPLTVDEGHVFVMGDNRNHSYDSRYPTIGQVSVDVIRGGHILTLAK